MSFIDVPVRPATAEEYVCEHCALVHWKATGDAACDRVGAPEALPAGRFAEFRPRPYELDGFVRALNEAPERAAAAYAANVQRLADGYGLG